MKWILKRTLSICSVLTIASISSNSFAADLDAATLLEKANTAYGNGDCTQALNLFDKAIKSNKFSEKENDQSLFKMAYCHFQEEKYSDSQTEFKKYLNKYPSSEEARLKLSQSYLYQNNYTEALMESQKIKSDDFKAQATIVTARSFIGLEQYKKAQDILKNSGNSAENLYWLGVAEYNNDQDKLALDSFTSAQKSADKNSWIYSDSKAWIDRINADKRAYHIYATVGWVEDSNIGQSGSSVTLIPGLPPSQGKTNAASTNADRGPYASIDLSYNLIATRKNYLTATASWSSPFYQSNSGYNNENTTLLLSYSHIANNEFTYGVDAKYLKSEYNNVYYQDYDIVTPYASWSVNSKLWVKASLPVNYYLHDKYQTLVTPSLDGRYDWNNWVSIYAGSSYTKSYAPEIKIANTTPPTVITGTIATHYNTTSFYAGLGVHLPYELELGFTETNATTQYDAEPLPPSSPEKPAPRKDVLSTFNVYLTKSWIKNVLSSTISFTNYENKSTGFQGLANSGSLSDNSYVRNYLMISTSYYY